VSSLVDDNDFSSFIEAVEDSADEEGRIRETRHTSSVGSDDWKRVEAARKANTD